MTPDLPDDVKRWTSKRRAAVVMAILRGETSAQEVARKYGLRVAEVEEWKDRFEMGAENALRTKPRDENAAREAHIKRLKEKIGELVMDLDTLKEATVLIEIWRREYNQVRPHSSLGYHPPAPEVIPGPRIAIVS